MTTRMQMLAIGFTQDCTATGRDHPLVRLRQVIDHLLLNITKTVLALVLKIVPY